MFFLFAAACSYSTRIDIGSESFIGLDGGSTKETASRFIGRSAFQQSGNRASLFAFSVIECIRLLAVAMDSHFFDPFLLFQTSEESFATLHRLRGGEIKVCNFSSKSFIKGGVV